MSDHDPQLCEIEGCLLCMPGPDQVDEAAIRDDERARLVRELGSDQAVDRIARELVIAGEGETNAEQAGRIQRTLLSLIGFGGEEGKTETNHQPPAASSGEQRDHEHRWAASGVFRLATVSPTQQRWDCECGAEEWSIDPRGPAGIVSHEYEPVPTTLEVPGDA